MFDKPEKRAAFIENVLAQATGTALGALLILIVGLAAGAIGDVSPGGVVAGLAVFLSGISLILAARSRTEAASAGWEQEAREKIIREAEERLRPMGPQERLRYFVPYPGGPAKPNWILEGLREPFRQEVKDSLMRADPEDGGESGGL